MATLNAQRWGVDGAGIVYASATADGDVGQNRAGLCLALKNVHATLARTLAIDGSLCDRGRYHDLLAAHLSVPATPTGGQPLLVPLGWSQERFPLIVLSYTSGHAADLRVALVYMDSLLGTGDAVASPPALGATPGVITRVGQAPGDDVVFTPADPDGMTVENGDDRTAILVRNLGLDAVVHVGAKSRCSQGFLDHYSVTVEANDTRQLPRFPSHIFGAVLEITYAAPGGLELAAIRLSQEGSQ